MAQKNWEDDSMGTGDELTANEFVEMANYIESDKIAFTTNMAEWEKGLSNEEIDRLALQSGETFVVERLEFRQKGGGSSSSASIRVQDITANSTIGSQDLGGVTKNPGTVSENNKFSIQLTNSTGSSIIASAVVVGRIVGA